MNNGNSSGPAPANSPTVVEQLQLVVGALALALRQATGCIEIIACLSPLAADLTVYSDPDRVQARGLDANGHWLLLRLPSDALPEVPVEYAGMVDIEM